MIFSDEETAFYKEERHNIRRIMRLQSSPTEIVRVHYQATREPFRDLMFWLHAGYIPRKMTVGYTCVKAHWEPEILEAEELALREPEFAY